MIFETVRRGLRVILPACFLAGLLSAQGLTITLPPNVPPASTSVSYLPITLTATGGTQPYTWIVAGVGLNGLPMGMTLSHGGVLSGQPTQTFMFQPIIQARDSANNLAQQQFTLAATTGVGS